MTPPEWLINVAKNNLVVAAYMKMWPVGESDCAAFFEALAQELAQQGADQSREYDRLAFAANGFCLAVDAAGVHQRRGRGGQQVSFHGDFASITPSSLSRLEWHARNMRDNKDNLEYAISFMEKQEQDLRAEIATLERKLNALMAEKTIK